jgi:hypothetical protein
MVTLADLCRDDRRILARSDEVAAAADPRDAAAEYAEALARALRGDPTW